jgi:uncharacterized membrane protein (UPF0127 family)
MVARVDTVTLPPRLARLPRVALGEDATVLDAVRPASRALGLARLATLAPRFALHIAPCRAVHTFGMRFSLDLMWLDADGTLLRIDERVDARRVKACRRARSVLETRAGEGSRFARMLSGQEALLRER